MRPFAPGLIFVAVLLSSSMSGFSQTPPKSGAAAKPALTAEQKAAKSKECSAEADKQKLHGKARRKFRSACKRK
jgi:hypothetical protein